MTSNNFRLASDDQDEDAKKKVGEKEGEETEAGEYPELDDFEIGDDVLGDEEIEEESAI